MTAIKFTHTHEAYEDGRIRNFKTGTWLKFQKSPNGYYKVDIFIDGRNKTITVHRVIAECFVPNPLKKKTVNHKDGNKLNNLASNLEWMTQRENNLHKNKILKRRQGAGNSKAVLDFSTGLFFDNGRQAAMSLCINISTLNSMLNGSRKNRTSLRYV